MLKNYLKIAFRNLFKQKVYSFIIIFGLAVGIACCLLILLYLNNELSYDEFHSKSDRLYRSWVKEDYGNGDIYWNTQTPFVLKETLEENIPEVESVARRFVVNDLVKADESSRGFSDQIQFVDPEFFSLFDFKMLKGNPDNVFNQPNDVVLTPSSAKRYFGSTDVLQKNLLIKLGDEFQRFTVSGIIEDAPSNSSIQYQLLIPLKASKTLVSERFMTRWFSVTPETYVLLKKNAELSQVEAKFTPMMKQALGEQYEESHYQVGLQPITDIRLNTEMPLGIAKVNDPVYLYILGGIALLVLLIACLNFMTLAISRSTSRAKEVGIRKSIGALRIQLMNQFWGEACLMTILALGLGLIFTESLLPYFNMLSGTSLALHFSPNIVLLAFGLVGLISLIAGIYPALILSGFKPIQVLKGKVSMQGKSDLFRTGMVVFQFTLSIALIVCTLIIGDQLDYMRSKDLGFQKDQIVVIQTDLTRDNNTGFAGIIEAADQKTKLLRSELASASSVRGVASSIYTPAQLGWINADYRDNQGEKHEFNINFCDAKYIDLMGLKFVKGRSFSDQMATDAMQGVIVNQAFVDEYGWENPLEEQIPGPDFQEHTIIGVLENFNYSPLRDKVEPLAIAMNPSVLFSGVDNIGLSSAAPRISVKIDAADMQATVGKIEAAWKKIAPNEPFNYSFLDQAVDSHYKQEERLSQIVTFGSVLAIIIACLGLFGLASLMVIRRTKEIGVRKVLGASASSIILLVNKEFTKLVAIAFLIAIPVSWYVMSEWLQDFAYRIELEVGVFLMAGIATLLVAWLTVSYQSIKATLINPVESLRSE